MSVGLEESLQGPIMTNHRASLVENETMPSSSEFTEQNDIKHANQYKEEIKISMQSDTDPPDTGFRADAGTDLPTGRASEASSVATYTNVAVSILLL